jgi:hypothetical protein
VALDGCFSRVRNAGTPTDCRTRLHATLIEARPPHGSGESRGLLRPSVDVGLPPNVVRLNRRPFVEPIDGVVGDCAVVALDSGVLINSAAIAATTQFTVPRRRHLARRVRIASTRWRPACLSGQLLAGRGAACLSFGIDVLLPVQDLLAKWGDHIGPLHRQIVALSDVLAQIEQQELAAVHNSFQEPCRTARCWRAAPASPDGRRVIFTQTTPKTSEDLMQLDLGGTHSVTPLVQSSFVERNGIVSPDGRWLAYEANDLGPFEIFVRPFPGVSNGHWQVSTAGGTRPLWSRSGQELFFVSSTGALMRVGVERGASWAATAPT